MTYTEGIEWLKDEQHRRCAYGTREGDGQRCDCKYPRPNQEHQSDEVTGCCELRAAIWILADG